MFTQEEIKLAPKVYEAIKKIAEAKGKEWKWEPEIGNFCRHKTWAGDELFIVCRVFTRTVNVVGESEDVYTAEPFMLIPILHWEKLEKIIEGFGYDVDIDKDSLNFDETKYFCVISTPHQTANKEIYWTPDGKGEGKTRQEAVQRAIIELAKGGWRNELAT